MRSAQEEMNDSLRQAVAILNQKGEIIYTTDLITKFLGYGSKELIGKSAFSLLTDNRQTAGKLRYQCIVDQDLPAIRTVLPVRHKTESVVKLKVTIYSLLRVGDVKGAIITMRT
jgi:PAS domain S-box-containing protein